MGTIGHVDHGKTTLTAAIATVQAAKGLGKPISYDEVAKASESQGRRDPSKILTIATSHVEYESEAALRAHRLPGSRGLCEEHDHRRGPDGRGDPGGAAADGPMPQTRKHILLARQVNVPNLVVFLNKIDLVDDPELLELVELEVRELLTKYDFKGDDIPVIRGSSLPALQNPKDPGKCIDELMKALDSHITIPQRDIDLPFLMPMEDVFSITGRGTVATGRIERGQVKVGDEVEIVGFNRYAGDYRHRRGNVPQDARLGHRRRQRRSAASRREKDEIERGHVLGQEVDQPAHEVRRPGVRLDAGGRRTAHAVLQRLSPAVLFPHDGRDRRSSSCPRAEM